MKDIALTEIAEILGCDPSDYTSNAHVHGLTTLSEATPETLSFVTGEKFFQEARETQAAGLVVPKGVDIEGKITFPVEDVWERVVNLLRLFYPRQSPTLQIHPSAIVNDGACFGKEISIGANVQIGNNARAGDNVVIESNCYVGSNVIIGDDTYICPNVTILNDVTIGNRVIIHPGAVIGSDGFKYEIVRGELAKIPQVGTVIIEDDVEIGANTCIDRASFTATRIGRGTKIDNLVQIAHNVEIGRNCMLAAQVGIAGSTKIGDNVRMAGQAGVVDNVSVGNGATIGAKSAVTKLVKPGQFVWGIPAVPIDQFKKSYAALRRLSKSYDARKKKKTD